MNFKEVWKNNLFIYNIFFNKIYCNMCTIKHNLDIKKKKKEKKKELHGK